LEQFAAASSGQNFNIILADGKLTLAAFLVWLRSGGNATRGRLLAPRGVGRLPQAKGLIGELVQEFETIPDTSTNATLSEQELEHFTYVIGNSKERSQILYAADSFGPVKRGLLLLKDYAHIESPDEREYLEGKRIFPAISFEGHAFVLRM
jgi:hypothetical protein